MCGHSGESPLRGDSRINGLEDSGRGVRMTGKANGQQTRKS